MNQITDWFGEEIAVLLSRDNPGRLILGEAIMDMPVATFRHARRGLRFWR